MNAVLPYAFPAAIALAGMLAIVFGLAAVMSWPRLLLLGFIACIVVFASSSSYGLEDPTEAGVFWVKGTRTFFFSFIEMALAGAWLTMLYRRAWERGREPWLPTSKYYVAFALILAGWVVAGLAEARHSTLLDLSQRGFTNLLWQGMFISLMVATVRSQEDLRRIAQLIVGCLFLRHLFGLVRYAAFGGDPQNAYATLGASQVRITFWDINDSILAALMFAYCAWRLLTDRAMPASRRVFWGVASLAALLIPLLSARRTAQGGMLLAIVALALLLPRGRRVPALLAMVVAVPLTLVALGQRSAGTPGGLLERVLIDVRSDPLSDPRMTRFHELRTAWQTLRDSPVLGLGPGGRFKVADPTGLEYHGGYYDYVHSGFGHVLLKTGFVGLALFCAMLAAWARLVITLWPRIQGPPRALAVASMAAMAASLPNLFVGAPVTEMRTMLLMGLLMAVPLVAGRLAKPEAAAAGAANTAPRTATVRPSLQS